LPNPNERAAKPTGRGAIQIDKRSFGGRSSVP